MRRSFSASRAAVSLAASIAALSACSSQSVTSPPVAAPIDWRAFDVSHVGDPAPAAPTAKERAVAPAYAAALASPGFALLAPSLDRDAHFAFPGMRDARGREPVVAAHEMLFGAFDGREVTVARVVRNESAQAVEWTLRGTQERDWMGVPATHAPVAIHGVTLLWTQDDGSITDIHAYFDVASVRVALGAPPDAHALGVRAPGVTAPMSARAALVVEDAVPVAKASQPPSPSEAPAEPPRVVESTGSAEEAAQVRLARGWLDALESHDESAYLTPLTEDVEVESPGRPRAQRGRDEARAFFRAIHKAVGQLDTTVANVWAAGPFVVLEYSISGEQLGPIGWVPAQRDKVVRLHLVDVLSVRDGRFDRVVRYENLAELLSLH